MPKKYRVIGTQPVHGAQPGDTFEADLPPHEEDILKRIGGIEEVALSGFVPSSIESEKTNEDEAQDD